MRRYKLKNNFMFFKKYQVFTLGKNFKTYLASWHSYWSLDLFYFEIYIKAGSTRLFPVLRSKCLNSVRKFSGQASNPQRRSNPCRCSDNARSHKKTPGLKVLTCLPTWVLPFTDRVTLGKLPNLPGLDFVTSRVGIITPSTWVVGKIK